MDRDFIERTVLTAAQEVFSTMLGMEAIKIPALSNADTANERERVVSLIGLAGDYIGTGMIGYSPKFACKAASAMMMSEYTAVDGEVLDATGEIANMIFGNVKTAVESRVGALGLSIPTVIFGRNFSTRSMGSQSWISVPMKVEGEEMDIRFCLAPNSAVIGQVKHGFKRDHALSQL